METRVRLPDSSPSKLVKWKVKVGSRINQLSILCLYKNLTTGKIDRLKWNNVGTVKKLLVKEDEDIGPDTDLLEIEGCTHPTVMKDMCAECGADLRDELSLPGARKDISAASVAMVHSVPELIVSQKEAIKLGKEDEARLLKHRKLVLLVDLDQTLIHTTNDNVPANLKDVNHFQLWHGPNLLWYHTKFRPGTVSFLETISQLYEMHICTFGVRMYAHTIARFLDPEGKYFSHRILSRNECFNPNSKTANLKALFPCGDTMVCIIDDREDVWSYAANLIPVKPYTFFEGTADINAPPGSSDDEKQSTAENRGAPKKSKRHSRIVKVSKKKVQVPEEPDLVSPDLETPQEKDTAAKIIDDAPTEHSSAIADHSPDSTSDNASTDANVEKTEYALADASLGTTATVVSQSSGDNDTQADANVEKTESALADASLGTTTTVVCQSSGDNDTQAEDGGQKRENVDQNEDSPCTEPEAGEIPKGDSNISEVEEEYEEMIEWDDNDDYLLYLEAILKRIHTAYYELYDQMCAKEESNDVPDMKSIIPYVKKKVLKGVNVLFSGVIPVSQPIEKSKVYHDAKALGANIHTEFITSSVENKDNTTHLIAARLGTAKVNAALKLKNLAIVNPEWLRCCAERWERVDEKLFILTEGMNMTGWDSPGRAITPEGGAKFKGGKLRKRGSTGSLKSKSKDAKEKGMAKASNGESSLSTDAPKDGSKSDAIQSRRFSETYNPLYAFSDDDIAIMDKEVEELLESGSDSEDEADELRRVVLGQKRRRSSSSEESLSSGDYPKGWKPPKKRSNHEEDSDGNNEGDLDEDKPVTPDNVHKLFKLDEDCTSSNDSEFNNSVGSVDEEMAAAVEKQFLSL